jgi:hypothetical protein
MTGKDYLGDLAVLQGGCCAECRDSDVDITAHAYLDAGDHEPYRLLCRECGVARSLVSKSPDPWVPERTVHWTATAEFRSTWGAVLQWSPARESERRQIIDLARTVARKTLELEEAVTHDVDAAAARVLIELAHELHAAMRGA